MYAAVCIFNPLGYFWGHISDSRPVILGLLVQLETKALSLVQIFGSVDKFGVGLDDCHYINALSLYIHVAQVFLSVRLCEVQ